MKLRTLCAALAILAACSSGSSPATDAAVDTAPSDASPADVSTADAPAADTTPATPDVSPATAALITARPYQSRAPSSYDGSRAMPLVILLHGYGASGSVQAAYFGFNALYESRNFLFAYPDGTLNRNSQRYWNATNGCCDFTNSGVDDVAYITAIIDDMSARYRVDPRRIFIVGHSNGGFMSHRMGCDRANRVAAIVSLAGAQWADATRCMPSEPVSVLQIHGLIDDTIRYMGGSTTGAASAMYPSARETVATWARLNRCGDFADTGMTFDYVTTAPGNETHVGRHAACMGGAAELWSMDATGHIPAFSPAWGEAVIDWLEAHPKPAR
jgi:polyhydroxybutyrate depolymerase